MLVSEATKRLCVTVRWADYKRRKAADGHGSGEEWERRQRQEELTLDVPPVTNRSPEELEVKGSEGLKVAISVRKVVTDGDEGELPKGTRSLSVFLVNRRRPAPDETRDEAFAFQTGLELRGEGPFVARPNLRSLESDDWDERVADLQYRDACEYAVGHSVATQAELSDGHCRVVRTCWIPDAEVERVAPATIPGVELSMDRLAELADRADAQAKLGKLATAYRDWIAAQKADAPDVARATQGYGGGIIPTSLGRCKSHRAGHRVAQ